MTGKATGNVVTDATNKTGGTEADGVWSGTLSPAYLAEYMHDYTASIKFRLDTFGYVAIGLRGEAALNPTYGYDWPQNSRFALDNGRLWLYIKGDAPIASSDISRIWNAPLNFGMFRTSAVWTIKEVYFDGTIAGTARG